MMLDAINERRSVRKYDGLSLAGDLRKQLERVLSLKRRGPFGGEPRFALVDREEALAEKGVKLGTYGFIKGAGAFIAGAIARAPMAEVDYGYALEEIILSATSMGLGTCWLGGTFSRADYGEVLSLSDDEFVPAVTPVGVTAERRGRMERLVRWGAKSDTRLPGESLFFDGAPWRPLSEAAAGDFAQVLEAVRRAPSASNKQPWRLVKDGPHYHLYLQRTPGYAKQVKAADLQHVDMGIAMYHVVAAAKALGLDGGWVTDGSKPKDQGLGEFIATWVCRKKDW